MKIIKLESCFKCPYSNYKSLDTIGCRRCDDRSHKVDWDAKFPDWCPLEDAKSCTENTYCFSEEK